MLLDVTDTDSRIVAVLHDVVEDHGDVWPLERIRSEGFSETVIAALDLSHTGRARAKEYFCQRRQGQLDNPIGRRVKVADINDNMDLKRISDLTDKEFRAFKKIQKSTQDHHSGAIPRRNHLSRPAANPRIQQSIKRNDPRNGTGIGRLV